MRDPVFRYLRTLRCGHPLAEEIAQETFFRLHRALADGSEVKDVRAWVFRVARNLCIDSRRERQRFGGGEPTDESHTDGAPDPEQQALARERVRLVEREALRLPGLERACMHLKAEGLRYHEIAAALDISMASAVDSVRRAVKRLGRRFGV